MLKMNNKLEINSKSELISHISDLAERADKLGEDFIYKVLLSILDMYKYKPKKEFTDRV